jgi:hypothetical protein
LKIAGTISGSWVGALYTMFAYAGATLVDGSITIEDAETGRGNGDILVFGTSARHAAPRFQAFASSVFILDYRRHG